MDKQKALFTTFLKSLGYSDADITKHADAMFPADAAKEPALDNAALLAQAQEYSKPFLRGHFETELKTSFKGRYYKEAMQKIMQESGGLIKREDIEAEGATVESITKLAVERLQEQSKATDTQKDEMIRALNAEKAAFKTEKETEINAVRQEYEAKETARATQAAMLKALAGKTLTVDAATAMPVVLNAISEKYTPKVNQVGGFDLYDKADPTKKAQKNATEFASFEEELNSILDGYKWIAKSQGGGGQQQQGGGGPIRLPLPQDDPSGKQAGHTGLLDAMKEAGMVQQQA